MRDELNQDTSASAESASTKLRAVGQQIRAHRKLLRVSATSAAQAAGMSRMTLYRQMKRLSIVNPKNADLS